MIAGTLDAARQELQAQRPVLEEERDAIRADLAKKNQELNRLVGLVGSGDQVAKAVAPHIAGIHESIQAQEGRLREVLAELGAMEAATVDEEDLRQALGLFDPVWDALLPRERIRILHLLLEHVDYRDGKLGLSFRLTGIKILAADRDSPGRETQ